MPGQGSSRQTGRPGQRAVYITSGIWNLSQAGV
jgi:hypothetical protein